MVTDNSINPEQLKIFEDSLCKALLNIDRLAVNKILEALQERWHSIQIIEDLFVSTLERIGLGWENGDAALSQVYMAGIIIEEYLDTVSLPTVPSTKNHAKIAITVLEDYHILGKRIVSSFLRSGGFKVIDYGQMYVDKLVSCAKNDSIEILLISTLMLRSALKVKDVRQHLKVSIPDLKIVVGGAPFRFDDNLWKEVGADAMARNASDVIAIINSL